MAMHGETKNTILLYKSSVTRTFRPGVREQARLRHGQLDVHGRRLARTCPTSTDGAVQHRQSQRPSLRCLVDGAQRTKTPGILTSLTGGTGASGPVEGRGFLARTRVGKAVYGEVQGRFFNGQDLKVNAGLSYRGIQRSMHDYLPICAVNIGLLRQWPRSDLCLVHYVVQLDQFGSVQIFRRLDHRSSSQKHWPLPRPCSTSPRTRMPISTPVAAGVGEHRWDFDPFNQIFGGVSSGFRTPFELRLRLVQQQHVQRHDGAGAQIHAGQNLEFNWAYEAGYRFHGDFVTASMTAYLNDISNYQASVQLDPVDFTTANIGGVKSMGSKPKRARTMTGFTFYGSASIQNDRVCPPTIWRNIPTTATGCGGQPVEELAVHTRGRPTGRYAELARIRLDRLQPAASSEASPPRIVPAGTPASLYNKTVPANLHTASDAVRRLSLSEASGSS